MPTVLNYLPEVYASAVRRALLAFVLRNNADAGKVAEAYMDGVLAELQRLSGLSAGELAQRARALESEATHASQ